MERFSNLDQLWHSGAWKTSSEMSLGPCHGIKVKVGSEEELTNDDM